MLIDLHIHTNRYSACSRIDPNALIAKAVKAGLNGLIITEHHHQWTQDELDDLLAKANEPGFVLLAGFEYTSTQGDILIYGLDASDVAEFNEGCSPEWAVKRAKAKGGVCIAAHPTRAGLGFDERIFSLDLDAVEVRSVNLQPHESRLAQNIARNGGIMPVEASDAHTIQDVGRYATDFSAPIQVMGDFVRAIKSGEFKPATA